MVSVNGGMVPPLGGGSGSGQGGGPQGQEKIEIIFQGKNRSSVTGTIDPNRGSVEYNKRKKYGKRDSQNGALSVEKDAEDCTATIYVHFWLNATKAVADKCSDEDIQSTIDAVEHAINDHWKGSECECDDPNRKPGCTFSVKVVWHSEEGAPAIPLDVDCEPPGESTPGVKIRLKAPTAGGAPLTPKVAGGYYAHEIGHQLFGTGQNAPYRDPKSMRAHKNDPSKPEPWNEEGHNPDPTGIMRDPKKHGGIGGDDMPSQEEKCILVDKFELCDMSSAGCCKKPKEEETLLVDANVVSASDVLRGFTV